MEQPSLSTLLYVRLDLSVGYILHGGFLLRLIYGFNCMCTQIEMYILLEDVPAVWGAQSMHFPWTENIRRGGKSFFYILIVPM